MLRLDVNSGTTANKVQAGAANKEKKLKEEVKEEVKEGSVMKTTTEEKEETAARTFYTHFDGILYECSWYEIKNEIIVVDGVKEKKINKKKNEKRKKKAKKKGKDKTTK